MPPHHLFGYNSKMAQAHSTTLEISDWRQLDRSELLEALRREPQVNQSVLRKAQEMNDKQVVVFKREGLSYHRYETRIIFFPSVLVAKIARLMPTFTLHFFFFLDRTILVAPSTVDFSNEPFYETRESFTPHGNFDHMDIILQRPLSSYHMNLFYI